MSDSESFDAYEKWLSIPPEDQPPHHYQLLGVEMFISDVERIDEAADSRMTHIRTFQTGPRGALTQQLLNEISAARICLTDDETRANYDRQLRGEPVEVDVQIAVPTTMASPMAPLGTAVADPMAPAGPTQGAMNPPAGVSASPQTATPPPVPGDVAIGRIITPTVRSSRRRKKSLLGTLLMFVLAIGGVAGAVWAIGQAMNRGEQKVDGEDQPKDDKGDTADTPSISTSDSATMVMQEANGRVNLTPVTAKLHGDNLVGQPDGLNTIVTNWSTTDQWVEWKFTITQTGLFTVQLTYAATASAAGSSIMVEIGDEKKPWTIRGSNGEDIFITDELIMAINAPGEHRLILRAKHLKGPRLMKLKSVYLIPKGS
ncbi:MAG TPA: hypothetical protein EYG57_19190 [Planctomycetes bacterium]|nr:hypothetical protein [Planctomycetota bacterium]